MYTCPMHQNIRQPQPGRCPVCGMDLVLLGSSSTTTPKRSAKDFLPLVVLLSLILALAGLSVWRLGHWDTMFAMRHFEGFFFLFLGAFKLLNWKGFVDAYSTYDIIAKRSRLYGYAYPLIELMLAAGYLLTFQLPIVAQATFVLMLIGSIGVAKELRKKNQIPCACLGVVFKIPMTWVTFIEDILMASMALVMLMMLS